MIYMARIRMGDLIVNETLRLSCVVLQLQSGGKNEGILF